MQLKHDSLKRLVLEELAATNNIDFLLEKPEALDEASILKNKYPFKAIYIFGPAGAGKSFLSKQIGIPKDFKVSNPDERIESVFPAFGLSMKFDPFEREKEKQASPLAKAQQSAREVLQGADQGHTANLLAIANPVVFDTTGENPKKLTARMMALMKVGYDVAVFMVNVPTDVSVSRDKRRKRTVGEPTKDISKEYQQRVVQDRAYFKNLADDPRATILGGDIYANLYDLRDNSLLPGITDEHANTMKTKDGKPYTPEYASQLLSQAKSDLQAWLKPEPKNPTGKTILAGMKALVKVSEGTLGQNMLQFGPATKAGIGQGNSAIAAATKLIADMGGVEVPLAAAQREPKPAGEKFGVRKGDEDPTIRDLGAGKLEERLATKIEQVLWKMLQNA
jgi:hypothetical protein